MNGADDGAEFAIATNLLDDSNSGWSNLGHWQHATQYAEACAALARQVGQAAQLTAQDNVLELACGHGAGLLLWQKEFGVQRLAGMDRQRACVENCRRLFKTRTDAVVQARFDVACLPREIPAHTYTAVICVDAAYHADSLHAFAALAKNALVLNGRLAFTTVLRGESWMDGSGLTAFWRVRCLRWLLDLAHIPPASVLAEADLCQVLRDAGFAVITLHVMDDPVLAGFPAYVQRRGRTLGWRVRCTPGWLKIAATAALCRFAHRHRLLHYGLIVAHGDKQSASR